MCGAFQCDCAHCKSVSGNHHGSHWIRHRSSPDHTPCGAVARMICIVLPTAAFLRAATSPASMALRRHGRVRLRRTHPFRRPLRPRLGLRLSGHSRVNANASVEGEALCDLRPLLVLQQTHHRTAEAGAHLRDALRVLVVRARRHHRTRARGRVLSLEDSRTHEDTVDTELHQQRDVGGSGQSSSSERNDGQATGEADMLHELHWHTLLLGVHVDLVVAHGLHLAHLGVHGACVAHRVHHVAGASVSLETDQGGALSDAAQRLTQVLRAADERDGERALVDVVGLVSRGEHLRLVDAVDLQRLEDLGLVKVTDPRLGHDRDRARAHHLLDHRRI
mmetsp:Transcript_62405/g.138981  ORF Transcript_62405/g.138981 Transcript_62405/m.138981 type:complete len:334 (-) Transcript_62405:195-1196(-)